MKKDYKVLKLTVHGSVKQITQYVCKNPADDSFVVGGMLVDAESDTFPSSVRQTKGYFSLPAN
jgi:hypothetical protein